MKIQERRAYFGFGVRDRAEAHRWLEEQGQRGWVLTRIRTGFFPTACFAPLEGPPPRYCVDVAHWSLRDPERQRDYDRLAADAGWSLAAQTGGMKIYRASPAGTQFRSRPIPSWSGSGTVGRPFSPAS